nr:MAG TPA: hypothetical protein [Caudoviricetes sp.]
MVGCKRSSPERILGGTLSQSSRPGMYLPDIASCLKPFSAMRTLNELRAALLRHSELRRFRLGRLLGLGALLRIGRFGRLLDRLRKEFLEVGILHSPKKPIKLHFAEARVRQIDIQSFQCVHFGAENIIIPRRSLGHLVVCNTVCADLLVRQVIDPNTRHFVHVKPFCGLIAGVSCDDGSFSVDEDGNAEAKPLDALRNRLNGRFVVPGIVLIRMDLRNILIHYLLIHFFSLLCYPAGVAGQIGERRFSASFPGIKIPARWRNRAGNAL